MTIGEKVAYLKGLTEGLAPADSSEMKLINKIIEILDEVAEELEELKQSSLVTAVLIQRLSSF